MQMNKQLSQMSADSKMSFLTYDKAYNTTSHRSHKLHQKKPPLQANFDKQVSQLFQLLDL